MHLRGNKESAERGKTLVTYAGDPCSWRGWFWRTVFWKRNRSRELIRRRGVHG